MKAIFAGSTETYTATDYDKFIFNCLRNPSCQKTYRVPLLDITRAVLFVDFGYIKPVTIEIQTVATCGDQEIQTIIAQDYVVGQTPTGKWYGVFKNFLAPANPLTEFVITMAFGMIDDTEIRYFSQEYSINDCDKLMELRSCYPDTTSVLGYDINGIYYGFHSGFEGDALGDATIRYYHRLYVRQGEIINTQHNTAFTSYLTNNFRTEVQKIFEFSCELVPEFYKDYIMSVMARGVITVRENDTLTKYNLNETAFELVDPGAKVWKTTSTFLELSRLYFGCDLANCEPPCIGNAVDFSFEADESGNYIFTFTGATFNIGDTIEWEILNIDNTPFASGVITGNPLQFTINADTGFDPETTCYIVRWRKVCPANDTGDFSLDFSDDFSTGSGTPNATDWDQKQIGTCAPPEETNYYILAEQNLVSDTLCKWNFTLIDANTDIPVSVIPAGVTVEWSYRKRGVDSLGSAVDAIVNTIFSGSIVSFVETVHNGTLDLYLTTFFCASSPIKYNVLESNWDAFVLTQVPGSVPPKYTPSTNRKGLTDLRDLTNFKLFTHYECNCYKHVHGILTIIPYVDVYNSDARGLGNQDKYAEAFFYLPIGSHIFTDFKLQTPFTGVATMWLNMKSTLGGNTTKKHTMNTSTGVIVSVG